MSSSSQICISLPRRGGRVWRPAPAFWKQEELAAVPGFEPTRRRSHTEADLSANTDRTSPQTLGASEDGPTTARSPAVQKGLNPYNGINDDSTLPLLP